MVPSPGRGLGTTFWFAGFRVLISNVSNRIDTNEQIELALPEQHFGLEMRGLHGGEERG